MPGDGWKPAGRRIISLHLPCLPTDRLRRGGSHPLAPLVTGRHDGRQMVVGAADRAARALGLHPGLALAQAQARVPGLQVVPADPQGDAAALRDLAAWCLDWSPLAAPDLPDGLLIDATGCTHLHATPSGTRQGGEAAMLRGLLQGLKGLGFAASAAMAGTPGAAHALARHAGRRVTVVPPGDEAAALACLPVQALRLEEGVPAALRRLGLGCVGALEAAPRAPLARRFGPGLVLRLDQAMGRVREPILPVRPCVPFAETLAFATPLLTAPALAIAIARLATAVCVTLERAGQGARRLELALVRVDGSAPVLRVGTARPSRAAAALAGLLTERLDTVDPGLGIEAMHLAVTLAEPQAFVQPGLAGPLEAGPDASSGDGARAAGMAALVDRLTNRLGAERVRCPVPVPSRVPERSVALLTAALPAGAGAGDWPAWPRPVRMFDPPQPVEALSLLPDQPPVAFTWRRIRRRIRRADGPERIHGEWWRRDREMTAVRDYFWVEDESGRRYWLFRRGDGDSAATGDLRWFVQGLA